MARLARPRWTDARLLVGILLVLTSVVAGSRVLASADRNELVWSAVHDLSAGIRLTSADVQVRAVRLDAARGNYLLTSSADPVGRMLTRPVSAGDLLPAAALALVSASPDERRQVTVPVASFHYPPGLARGHLVDVYVTVGSAASAGAMATPGSTASNVPMLLIAGALVVDISDGGSSFSGPSASIGVVLSVPGDQVAALVAGIRAGPVDLVQVPDP